MKAILEFDLDNPDDRDEHKRAVLANEMASFIWDLLHNTDEKIPAEIYSYLYDNLYSRGIVIDDIWK